MGDGHVDGVYSMAKDPGSLERFASGSGDGMVKVWDLTTRGEVWETQAHENMVKGVCWTPDRKLLSCASDKTIKLWDPYNSSPDAPPMTSYLGTGAFNSVSHHRSDPAFAAASNMISIYDLSRPSSSPSQTMHWPTSVDTITSLAFNQTETSILGSTALDRSVILYDLRTSSPVQKMVLKLASNAIAWNPMEAFNFAVANEDHNAYIFDMRKTDRALNVLKDHVAAVMDIEFSPTGEELVTASYDKTIRLWDRARGHSRDIYHTGRMQRYVKITIFFKNILLIMNLVFSRPNSHRITNMCCLGRTMVMFVSGVPRPPTAAVSRVLVSVPSSNTTRHLSSDTPTCPKSVASSGNATCPSLLRRLVRSSVRNLVLLRDARRMCASTLARPI
jgi:WD repeat and SOF domain-containing protein 1